MNENEGSFRGEPIGSISSSISSKVVDSRESLSNLVEKAARSSRIVNANKENLNLHQLRLSNMKLHGREDDMKLLRDKLLELKQKKHKQMVRRLSSSFGRSGL